jgi:hypothetical protein
MRHHFTSARMSIVVMTTTRYRLGKNWNPYTLLGKQFGNPLKINHRSLGAVRTAQAVFLQ